MMYTQIMSKVLHDDWTQQGMTAEAPLRGIRVPDYDISGVLEAIPYAGGVGMVLAVIVVFFVVRKITRTIRWVLGTALSIMSMVYWYNLIG